MNHLTLFFKEGLDFFYQIFYNRNLIITLSKRDFNKLYISNFFGLIWAILDPLAYVIIFYLVFGARYGSTDVNVVPFFTYLITGYVALSFFVNSITGITVSIKMHDFLLKKVNFRVAILPIVTLFTNLMVHGIEFLLCIIILALYHIYPTLYWFQILYYLFALSVFLISVGWFTSSVYLFFPDIKNVVGIISRLLLFVTPIFWNMHGLPESNQFILKLNPIYYIVNGYRDSLLYQKGFWEEPILTCYFWAVCLVFLLVGVVVFKKLRPHFADVVA